MPIPNISRNMRIKFGDGTRSECASIRTANVCAYLLERPDAVRQNIYYVRELEELNDTHVFSKKLLLTNAEAALLSDQVNYHFSSINDYSRLIEINPSNPLAYFGRAVDFMLVQDFF